jgi:fatty acid amide hydrolase
MDSARKYDMKSMETDSTNREPCRFGAGELARRISDGSITAVEAVESYIARIEVLQPTFQMVTQTRFTEARAEAQAADDRRGSDDALPPLLGVPITVKECFDVAGLPTNLGVTAAEQRPAAKDARLIQKLRSAGAIVLAKTNIPQLGLYLESDNPRFGRTLNPWDEERTCGGSSGGEAVATALGCSALGVGSDLGGSLRVPAHFCGIHSFKPTSRQLSLDGVEFALPGMNAIPNVAGFLARNVEDIALAFQFGREKPSPAARRYGPRRGAGLTGTRVAILDDHPFFPVSPAIKRVVHEAGRALQDCGAELTTLELPDFEHMMHLFFSLLSADGGVAVRKQLSGSEVDGRLQMLLRVAMLPSILRRATSATLRRQGKHHSALMVDAARKRTTDEYWQLTVAMDQMKSEFSSRWEQDKIDLLLLPPCALPAFAHGQSSDLVTSAVYAVLANLVDMPAGVVAASRIRHAEESSRDPAADAIGRSAQQVELGSAGLPVGVQIMGTPLRDRKVLGAMTILERHFGQNDDSPLNAAKSKWPS